MNAQEKRQKELFENTPIPRAIARLALPTIVGQIILVVYNMADTFFVGLTGSDAMITAVTVCMPAFMFLSAISNLFGVGGASVIARALGRHDPDRARGTAAFALYGCILTTLLYSLGAFLFRDRFLDLLGGRDAEVHAYARQYLLVTVCIGGLSASMSTLLSHLIRSEGRSLQSSIGIALGGVLNIALDPLFMFVLLPPGQEALGAALATALSNTAALLYFIAMLRHNRQKSVLAFEFSHVMLEDHVPRDVIYTGLPACLMTLMENISYAVLDAQMALNGTAMQAGLGVAKKVNMLAHCMVRGMSQGVLPLIAYNYAAGDHKRMRTSILLSAGLSVALAALCTGVSLLFSRALIGVFIQHASLSLESGAKFLRILCLGGPFSACAYAFISFFQAVGKARLSFVLAILRKGLLDIPLMFLLGRWIPVYGVVWATPITDVVCCLVSIQLFIHFMKTYDALPPEVAV